MKNNIIIIILICLILPPCIANTSCFRTNGADENADVNDDFCNAYGYIIGYENTPEMSISHPNAAFDPVIKAKHCTCFFREWVSSTVTLRDGECSGLAVYVVYARKEQIGLNADGHVCHPEINNQNFSECQKQTTALCLRTSSAGNCFNKLGITEHVLKCLPIPITPAPPATCKQMITKTYPKIIPVSLKQGNSYFKPKVKLMIGEEYKVCSSGIFGAYYQPISTNEHSSKQYKCPSGDTFIKIVLPEKEASYDIDPFNETSDIFTYNGDVIPVKFKPSFEKICIEIDGLTIDCLPRELPQVNSITYNKSENTVYYTLIDENKIQQSSSIKVTNTNDIKQKKIKNTKLLNKNINIDLYAAKVSYNNKKNYIDYYINCPNGELIDPEENKSCQDIIINAFTCNGRDVVSNASDCTGNTKPQKTTAKKCTDIIIPNTKDNQCTPSLKPNYTENSNTVCIFGYNDSNILFFNGENNEFIPSYKTSELLFVRNSISNNGINLTSLNQSELNTYSGTIGQGTIIRNNSKTPPTGTKYELKRKETQSGSRSTTIFNKETNNAIYLTKSSTIINDPMLSGMCTTIN